MSPFLTIPEVARRLGRTAARCYQMARAGELPVVEVGGRLVVPVAALDQWIREKTQHALATMQRPRGAKVAVQSEERSNP